MLVKICGITCIEDAKLASGEGADLIGTVFVKHSKRYITIQQANKILNNISPNTIPVALFQNEKTEQIIRVTKSLNYPIIQLHGQESSDYVNNLINKLSSTKIIKAFLVTDKTIVEEMIKFYQKIQNKEKIFAFLLDAKSGGGSGTSFNWKEISEELNLHREKLPKILLAGGLTVENVSRAIEIINPDGVDVSSGVEIKAGKKDANKVKRFISLAKGNY